MQNQCGAAWRIGIHPPPHQPSRAGSASATPPQGGSDTGTPYASLTITLPLRGSRREGEARSRAGGGQTPRPLSPYQRQGQLRVGGVGALEGFRQSYGAPSAVGIGHMSCRHQYLEGTGFPVERTEGKVSVRFGLTQTEVFFPLGRRAGSYGVFEDPLDPVVSLTPTLVASMNARVARRAERHVYCAEREFVFCITTQRRNQRGRL